jgi:cob(I)alamin adenosyltransferase
LFIIQAEVAGADMHVEESTITKMEEDIKWIEESLPPITTFFVSGGSELAALCDIARTVARRCERRVVVISEKGDRVLSPHTLVYLNRLSSLLYALARLSNHFSGITEQSPRYS